MDAKVYVIPKDRLKDSVATAYRCVCRKKTAAAELTWDKDGLCTAEKSVLLARNMAKVIYLKIPKLLLIWSIKIIVIFL